MGGFVGIVDWIVYYVLKYGVLGLIKSSVLEYVDWNVWINVVCLGIIDILMVVWMDDIEW